jgi:glutamate-1-semialdehyde 2,1-aminomutase/spore coat polysaccharide biosynthesis protein SpsF
MPGKILKPLGSRSVLEEVLYRCAKIPGADTVICAIPDQPEDEPLVPLVQRSGAMLIRGDTEDVLARYRIAAEAVGTDIVLRVTSDCPLIDPELCGEALKLRANENADYACNNMPPSFPHGLDCEVFTADALRRADRSTINREDREHVTPWLRRDPGVKRAVLKGPGGHTIEQRWTLDYPEDYEFLRRIFELLPPNRIPPWTEVMKLIDSRPDIQEINAGRRVSRI